MKQYTVIMGNMLTPNYLTVQVLAMDQHDASVAAYSEYSNGGRYYALEVKEV